MAHREKLHRQMTFAYRLYICERGLPNGVCSCTLFGTNAFLTRAMAFARAVDD